MHTPSEKNTQSRLYLPDLSIHLYLYHEGPGIVYQFFFKDKLLFSGNEYRPSPVYDPFSLPSMIGLLDWIALAPGDTDKEYFESYTPAQLAWCKTIQQQDLTTYLYDYEGGKEEVRAEAEAYFEQGFTRYTHPDEIFTLYEVMNSKPNETIFLTRSQKKDLLRLFNRNSYTEATIKKLSAAVEDSFKKVKKDERTKAIIFEKDQVTFAAKRSYRRELHAIRKNIIHNY